MYLERVELIFGLIITRHLKHYCPHCIHFKKCRQKIKTAPKLVVLVSVKSNIRIVFISERTGRKQKNAPKKL